MNSDSSVPVLPISVVIPAYNAAPWLRRCLAAVFEGTRLPAEVFVVDDGSTDDTRRIAREMGATVLEQSRAGPSAARNRAMRIANQEWTAFLDADDEWHPRKLELQYDLVDANPRVDFVFTDWDEVGPDGSVTVPDALTTYWNYASIEKSRNMAYGFECEPASFATYMPRWPFLALSSVMVRTRRALAVGAFPEHMAYAEDLDFFLRYLRDGVPGVVELPLVAYLRHSGQATAQKLRVLQSFVDLATTVVTNPTHYHRESVATLASERPHYLADLGAAQIGYAPADALRNFVAAIRTAPSLRIAVASIARSLARRSWPNRWRRSLKSKNTRSFVANSGTFAVPWRRPHSKASD